MIAFRISPAMKKTVRVYCALIGRSEQDWLVGLIRKELERAAPELYAGLMGEVEDELALGRVD